MSLITLIYLAGVSGGALTLFNIALGFGIVLTITFSISLIFNVDDEEARRGIKTFLKVIVPVTILAALLVIVIPSEKTTNKMLAAYLSKQVYDSPEAKQIGNTLLAAANKKLDELMGDKK